MTSKPKPFRDPTLPPRPVTVVPTTAWRCRECGHSNWAHADYCARCGEPKPRPVISSFPAVNHLFNRA